MRTSYPLLVLHSLFFNILCGIHLLFHDAYTIIRFSENLLLWDSLYIKIHNDVVLQKLCML